MVVRSLRRIARTAAVVTLASLVSSANAEGPRVLLLSAYPTEQALILAAAQPVTEAGIFNGRRFFAGTIAGKEVVMGLTGIGLVNADRTTREALVHFGADYFDAVVFSGVAGSRFNVGDVVIPNQWRIGTATYDVDATMHAIASTLVDEVPLDRCLPVEDVTCTGQRPGIEQPAICMADPQIRPGGVGSSSDFYGDRAVPCLSSAGGLIGCEACGAPLNESPDLERFATGSIPFFVPRPFILDLFSSGSGGGGPSVVGDQETGAAARVADEKTVPFLAFRAVSDGAGDPNPVTQTVGFPVQFFVYQQLAADNAAHVVLAFLEAWDGATTP
jgi:nucleoside phosphorylase